MEPVPFAVQEEIALEGLDGITLDTFWFRMSERLRLPLPFPEKFKNSLWNLVIKEHDYEYFEIRESRITPQRMDRKEMYFNPSISDEEMESTMTRNYYIYTYHPVDDQEIRGSCQEFKSRKKIDQSHLEQLSLMEIEEMYAGRLVIVASQKSRNSILIPSNIGRDCEINNITYCILERIGRSRQFGEATSGKFSLNDFVKDSKLVHYFRGQLMSNHLVARQTVQQKIRGKFVQIQLFHLPKFFVLIEVLNTVNTEKLFKFLLAKPNYVATTEEARNCLDLKQKVFRVFIKTRENLFKTGQFPYKLLNPNATPKECLFKSKTKSGSKEKTLNGVQLLNPKFDIFTLYVEEKEEEIDTETGFLDSSNQLLNASLAWQVVKKIEDMGSVGMSQAEIGNYFGLSRLNSRAIVRKIQRSNVITFYLKDEGRQRTSMYVHKKFKNAKTKEIVDQVKKLIQKADESAIQAPIQHTNNTFEETPQQTGEVNSSSIKISIPFELLKPESNDNDIIKIIQQQAPVPHDKNEPFVLAVDEPCLLESVQHVEVTLTYLNNLPGVFKPCKGLAAAIASNKVSPKVLNRMNVILDILKEKTVIDTVNLLNAMRQKEMNFKEVICRKSMITICRQLAADNFLKVVELEMKTDTKRINIIFLGEPNVTLDLRCWNSIIEEQKIVHFLRPMTEPKCGYELEPTISNISFESKTSAGNESYSAQSSKHISCNIPKFQKYKLFHEFLYYLVYDYPTEYQRISIKKAIQIWKQSNQNITDIDAISTNISTCYSTDFNWKMFVPPLNQYRGYESGWALLKDIINRIPLILYVKFTRFAVYVPDLQDYLNHPIKCNYLIHFLPTSMRNALLQGRKHTFVIHELTKRLCHLGLLQMGQQRTKEIDYTYYYLNRNALLLDTTTNNSNYDRVEEKEYEQLTFYFNSPERVTEYWKQMMKICISTKIGREKDPSAVEESFKEYRLEHKKELHESLIVQTSETAPLNDVGILPGDRRGVAGIDTSFYAHVRLNWSKEPTKSLIKRLRKRSISMLSLRSERMTPLKKKRKVQVKEETDDMEMTINDILSSPKKEPVFKKPAIQHVVIKKAIVTRKRTRTSLEPKKKIPSRAETLTGMNFVAPETSSSAKVDSTKKAVKKKPVEDIIDKIAIELQKSLRCTWSDVEDETLIVIKTALKFLFPSDPQCSHYCPSPVIRDILHWRTNKGLTKTTTACKRRILYLLKHKPQYKEKIAMYLEELSSTREFASKYNNFLENIKKKYKDTPKSIPLVVKIHAVELVHRMHQVFLKQYLTSSIKSGEIFFELPSEYHEIKKAYTIVHPSDPMSDFIQKEPTNPSEVQISTISSLIHSALCCAKDRTNIQYYLYETYKKFKDDDLTKGTNLLRRLQVVTLNKTFRLHETPMTPYGNTRFHLANRYATQLGSVHITTDLFDEYLEGVRSISESEDLHQMKKINCGLIFMLAEYLNNRKINLIFEKADKLIMVDPSLRKKTNFDQISDNYLAAQKEVKKSGVVKNKQLRFHPDSNSDEKYFHFDDPIEIFFKYDSFYTHLFCLLSALEKGEIIRSDRWAIEEEVCTLKNCITKADDYALELQKIACHSYEMLKILLSHEPIASGSQEDNESFVTNKNLMNFFDQKIVAYQTQQTDFNKKDIGKKSWDHHYAATTKILLTQMLKLATDIEQEDGAWLTEYKKISHKSSEDVYDDEDDDPIKHSTISHQLKDLNVSMRSSDSFVVNLSTIYIEINGDKSESVTVDGDLYDKRLVGYEENSRNEIIDKIKRNHVWMPENLKINPLITELKSISSNSPQLMEICKFIIAKKEMGATSESLLVRFGNKWELQWNLDILIKHKIIIRSGVNEFRFIHKEYASKWLVKTLYLTEKEEDAEEPQSKKSKTDENAGTQADGDDKKNFIQHPYYVLPVPWVRIGPLNRSLNRRCLDKWLGTILNYVSLNPSIYINDLRAKFNVLNIIQVRILCEILEEIGCIKLLVHDDLGADIFSEYEVGNLEEPASYFDSFERTFMEISIDAFQRLAVFIGKKKYKTPFI